MTKLRILFRSGDSIEFPVKDRKMADEIICGAKYDNTVQGATTDGKAVATWLGSECVAIVVMESGGKP